MALTLTPGSGMDDRIAGIYAVSGSGTDLDGTQVRCVALLNDLPVAAASADVSAPSVNTNAVVTYAGVAALKHVITGIAWSYAGVDPVAGNLKVEDVSGTTVFTMDITLKGDGLIPFPKPKKSAAVNTAMIITLAAGGASCTGKVTILNHWTEP